MKMNRIAFVTVAAWLLLGALTSRSQTVGVPVEGRVTTEGKPLPNAQIVFTNVDNGRAYKSKTDKNGNFAVLGVPYGNFRVEVLGEKGEKLFRQQTSISSENTTSTNFISIDIPPGGAPVDDQFGVPATSGPKLTKEQLAKIEADNKKIAGLNSLITEIQTARQAQDWPKAESALKKLIAAAPDSNRWDFYMFLGEAQSRSNKFEEATQTYNKGIQLAQSVISGSTPADPKIPTLNPATAKAGAGRMLTAQGNDYLKLQKQEEAIASLKKAAELDPTSAMASYNLCGVEFSAQKYDDARISCNKYLQLEPAGAHADEVKGFLSQMGK
jgi:tetratricopeptide (TPR) repeat protein